MQSSKVVENQEPKISSFDLKNFIKQVFAPKKGEKLCILIDLENPADVKDFAFLEMDGHTAQKKAHEVFYQGLKEGIFPLDAVDFFAYQMTSGNNSELPTEAVAVDGSVIALKDIYTSYNIILGIGTFSATAPLTAAAKEYDFRGATMPGLDDFIINSGLSIDYQKLKTVTENIRLGLTGADSADLEFEVGDVKCSLHLYLGDQLAQKNDGICHKKREFVNLPAGKVYFVPFDAEGSFPMKFEDGSIALMLVSKGKVTEAKWISGNKNKIKEFQKKINSEKVCGIIGELGFGTSQCPYSGCYAQDGKIFGKMHLGIGRNDHLHGSVNLRSFIDEKNASHEDILFSKEKTPEIKVIKVTLNRNGKKEILIQNDEPGEYLLNLFNVQ